MARCEACGKWTLGGIRQGERQFCSDACHQAGYLVPLAEQMAPQVLQDKLRTAQSMPCPICHGPGPIDVFEKHTAISFIRLTSWKSQSDLGCQQCGRRAIWKAIATTALCGWWALPVGPIVTVGQLIANFRSLAKLNQRGTDVSPELYRHVASETGKPWAEQSDGLIVPRRRAA